MKINTDMWPVKTGNDRRMLQVVPGMVAWDIERRERRIAQEAYDRTRPTCRCGRWPALRGSGLCAGCFPGVVS